MSNKKLIEAYKKANKERRKRIIQLAGFATETDYLNSLNQKTKKATKKVVEKAKPVDMVIAFDTTGSMGSYIDNVKKHVKNLIPELFSKSPNLKIKIVAFGDYCDMDSNTVFGKAYQEIELTDNQNDLINFVNSAQNTSGGDSDEFYELVIRKITEETKWRKDSERSVLLIADANPHDKGYYTGHLRQVIDWKEEAVKSSKLNIKWDTLTISSYCEDWYKELSKITGGVSLPFRSANKMSQVVEAVTYARSASTSEVSKAAFMTKSSVVMDSGDEELIGVYKSLSTLL